MTLLEQKKHAGGALLFVFVLAAVGLFWEGSRDILLAALLLVAVTGIVPLCDEDDEVDGEGAIAARAADRTLYEMMRVRFGDDPARWPDWVCFAQGNAEAETAWICGQTNNGWSLSCGRCGAAHPAPAPGHKDPLA